jgi:hypothetical protein
MDISKIIREVIFTIYRLEIPGKFIGGCLYKIGNFCLLPHCHVQDGKEDILQIALSQCCEQLNLQMDNKLWYYYLDFGLYKW